MNGLKCICMLLMNYLNINFGKLIDETRYYLMLSNKTTVSKNIRGMKTILKFITASLK